MNASDVKTALIKYQKLKDEIQEDKNLIEEINAKRFKIGGSIAKLPENPKPRSEVILNNLEKIDSATQTYNMHMFQLWIVNDFLDKISMMSYKWPKAKQIILDRYVKCYSQSKMEEVYDLEIRIINRNISKYIDWYVEHHNNSLKKVNK